MCILFVLVGNRQQPSIILSNRDEYLDRKTTRGMFNDTTESYAPLDLEGGGTWLSVENISQQLRYAAVLNNHIWRESIVSKSVNIDTIKSFRSRGLLISDFMKGNLSAKDYANEAYQNRSQYRPFNLLISDYSGTFYVGSNAVQRTPERLTEGRWYCLTNGHLRSDWDKARLGLSIINSSTYCLDKTNLNMDVVIEEAKHALKSISNNLELNDRCVTNIAKNCSTESKMASLAQRLLNIMLIDISLPDPTFGTHSAAAMQLSSIFVKPTLVVRSSWHIGLLAIYTVLSEVLIGLLRFVMCFISKILSWTSIFNSLIHMNNFSNQCNSTTKESLYGDVKVLMHYYIMRTAILSRIQTICRYSIISSILAAPSDVFGTRTTTVIIHIPTANKQSTVLNESSEKNDCNTTASYYILERDLDTTTMKWSTQTFTNLCD